MPAWIREDAAFDSHPKAIAAGWWGARAAETIWRIAKLHGRRGRIKPCFATGEYLAAFTRSTNAAHADRFREGIAAAIIAGLLTRDVDGTVEVHDWDHYQWDETNAERQRRYREKSRVVTEVTGGNGCNGYPTPTPPHIERDQTCPAPSATGPAQGETSTEDPDQGTINPPSMLPAPPAAGKKGKKAGLIDMTAPAAGLSGTGRIRRNYYARWESEMGAPYPQSPDKDEGVARMILQYHQKHALPFPWQLFARAVIRAYISTPDPWLTSQRHPMELMHNRFAQLVADVVPALKGAADARPGGEG